MKRLNWQIIFVISLITSSLLLYFLQVTIFHTPRDTLFYILQDFAFVPIQVLLVTLIIHRLLAYREKRALLNKLNMVIGAFFSEIGTELLKDISKCDINSEKIRNELIVTDGWLSKKFLDTGRRLVRHDYKIDIQRADLEKLRKLLIDKRNFLVSLLENPNLLEHESFTNLLWAVFHLAEELAYRTNVKQLAQKDSEHIAGDIKRAYSLLISEWLSYMGHLKESYPYLFSLALRTNPFNPNVSVEIK